MARRLSRDEYVAHHEAGHAVMSYMLLQPFGEVTTIPGFQDDGTRYDGGVEMGSGERDAVGMIMVMLAGAVAVGWARGLKLTRLPRDTRSAGDMEQARSCAEKLGGEWLVKVLWQRTKETLRPLQVEVDGERVVSNPAWVAVEALADELIDRRRLGPRVARRIIREAISESQIPVTRPVPTLTDAQMLAIRLVASEDEADGESEFSDDNW